MKHGFNFCFSLTVAIMLLSAINCNNAPTLPSKMIRITYPRGGETFSRGDRVIIQWTATGSIDEVDIFLFASFDNYGEVLAQNIPAEIGRFTWIIQTCPAYNQYFRIEITDSASLAAMTASLGFTIKKCS